MSVSVLVKLLKNGKKLLITDYFSKKVILLLY